MDLVLSSAAETELAQPGGTPEELDKSITAAEPLQEKCCGCQPICEGHYSTVTIVDAPLNVHILVLLQCWGTPLGSARLLPETSSVGKGHCLCFLLSISIVSQPVLCRRWQGKCRHGKCPVGLDIHIQCRHPLHLLG